MTSDATPSQEGLERDLVKVLTVGVGRPVRKQDEPISDLEAVAAWLSEPSLPPVRQVEEVVREAIKQFGTSSFFVGMALVFGAHEDTADMRKATDRRRMAATKLNVSEYTLAHELGKRMRELIAEHLLKRYVEAGGTIEVEEPSALADEGTDSSAEEAQQNDSVVNDTPADNAQFDAERTAVSTRLSQRWRQRAALSTISILSVTILAALLITGTFGNNPTPRTASDLAGIANALQPSYTSATARLQLVVEVKLRGETAWHKHVSVLPGADLFWTLGTKDVSEARLDNVVLRDTLPRHMKVVPRSVRLINARGDRIQADKPLFTNGINVGNYEPGGTQYAVFDTIAQEDFPGCKVTVHNVGTSRSDPTSTGAQGAAEVQIIKSHCLTK